MAEQDGRSDARSAATGASIDNNILKSALTRTILDRKKGYKTRRVADLCMSLIDCCELNAASPFDFLNELRRHSTGLSVRAAEWTPRNYRDMLSRLAAPAAA